MAGASNRRAAYIVRGYSTSRDVVSHFLQAFDVEDGRALSPMRTRTVTAPQALFLMNSEPIDRATAHLAERPRRESGGSLPAAVVGDRVYAVDSERARDAQGKPLRATRDGILGSSRQPPTSDPHRVVLIDT